MPTYDYICDACQKNFELFQSMKDAPVKKCPHCGKAKARRLLGTGGGIIFKGSGFYQTDYKSSGAKPESKAESKSKPENGSGEPKSCSKPDSGSKK